MSMVDRTFHPTSPRQDSVLLSIARGSNPTILGYKHFIHIFNFQNDSKKSANGWLNIKTHHTSVPTHYEFSGTVLLYRTIVPPCIPSQQLKKNSTINPPDLSSCVSSFLVVPVHDPYAPSSTRQLLGEIVPLGRAVHSRTLPITR